jgi:hypothetical protein
MLNHLNLSTQPTDAIVMAQRSRIQVNNLPLWATAERLAKMEFANHRQIGKDESGFILTQEATLAYLRHNFTNYDAILCTIPENAKARNILAKRINRLLLQNYAISAPAIDGGEE